MAAWERPCYPSGAVGGNTAHLNWDTFYIYLKYLIHFRLFVTYGSNITFVLLCLLHSFFSLSVQNRERFFHYLIIFTDSFITRIPKHNHEAPYISFLLMFWQSLCLTSNVNARDDPCFHRIEIMQQHECLASPPHGMQLNVPSFTAV